MNTLGASGSVRHNRLSRLQALAFRQGSLGSEQQVFQDCHISKGGADCLVLQPQLIVVPNPCLQGLRADFTREAKKTMQSLQFSSAVIAGDRSPQRVQVAANSGQTLGQELVDQTQATKISQPLRVEQRR